MPTLSLKQNQIEKLEMEKTKKREKKFIKISQLFRVDAQAK